MKCKRIRHKGTDYSVEFDFDEWHTILKINNTDCENVVHPRTDVYASVVPEKDGKLMVLIYNNRVYFFDIDSDTDIEDYAKRLTGLELPKWTRFISIMAASALLFFEIWYGVALREREIWNVHQLIPLFIAWIVLIPKDYVVNNPKVSLRCRRWWHFGSLIAIILVQILYCAVVFCVK